MKFRDKKLYRVLDGMKTRCHNINDPHYKFYGGKGISICSEWLHNFVTFRDWALSHGYQGGLTIDRIDNNGNYEPENCQWITRSINASKDRKKPVNQLDFIGNLIGIYPSELEASRQTGISQGNISSVCCGIRDSAGGFKWVLEVM